MYILTISYSQLTQTIAHTHYYYYLVFFLYFKIFHLFAGVHNVVDCKHALFVYPNLLILSNVQLIETIQ